MSDLQVALEERSNLMRKLTTTVKNAAELEKHTEKLREVVDAITVSALTDGELAANQRLFLRLEADSGVKIIDLRPQGVVPAGAGSSFVFMNFSLSVSGDYRQIMLFLKKLEHGSTLSRIINTTLSSNEQSGESAILSVDLLGVKK
jgi:Tfp pilus assembly protein PilO